MSSTRLSLNLLLFALLPWPTVWLGLFVFHSAWTAFLLYHGVCITGWMTLRPTHSKPHEAGSVSKLVSGVAIASLAANGAAVLFARPLMPLVGYLEIGRRLAALGAPPTTTAELLLTAYFAIVNPLAEELFWRATVYERLRELDWPHWQSATVSSALFASWHVLPIALLVGKLIAIPAAAGVFLAGLAFATVHDRSRNCWVTISCHALAADVPLLVFCWLDVFHVL